ncbi:MAG: prepilin-type N-terminal cleavage/methylation domain-containing protein [Kiritimatiellae bacterium]|nr:prepilin-type N-terminal cleavage/methylation domain-containing protein [Kiritimatiellia bacterium]
MTPRRAGFSLVEALLACALLGLALVPAIGAFRAHLAAIDRASERLRVERLLDARLESTAARLAAGGADMAVSGSLPEGLTVFEPAPEVEKHGEFSLWRFEVRVSDPSANIALASRRHLLLPPPREEQTRSDAAAP